MEARDWPKGKLGKVHRLNIEDLESEISELKKSFKTESGQNAVFKVQPMNQWLADAGKKPMPKMLLSELWYEGEICFLFADTNLGKSALSVQIADAITKGKSIEGFKLELEEASKVLLFDFELSEKQVEIRYSDQGRDHYRFSDLLLRAEPIGAALLEEGHHTDEGDAMLKNIEEQILNSGAKLIIIDNLTYLHDTLEKAQGVLPLMKRLKALKDSHGFTFLILAHTPKRDKSKPIEGRDLFGSSNLMNFADSAFAIGYSQQGEQVRYIKQIKQRNCEKVYGKDNVIVCDLVKRKNFMFLHFVGYGAEREHLYHKSKEEKEAIAEQLVESYRNNPNQSLRALGEEHNMHPQQVKRVLGKAGVYDKDK